MFKIEKKLEPEHTYFLKLLEEMESAGLLNSRTLKAKSVPSRNSSEKPVRKSQYVVLQDMKTIREKVHLYKLSYSFTDETEATRRPRLPTCDIEIPHLKQEIEARNLPDVNQEVVQGKQHATIEKKQRPLSASAATRKVKRNYMSPYRINNTNCAKKGVPGAREWVNHKNGDNKGNCVGGKDIEEETFLDRTGTPTHLPSPKAPPRPSSAGLLPEPRYFNQNIAYHDLVKRNRLGLRCHMKKNVIYNHIIGENKEMPAEAAMVGRAPIVYNLGGRGKKIGDRGERVGNKKRVQAGIHMHTIRAKGALYSSVDGPGK